MVERIRTLLEIRQLTPTQFADLIGVARPIVSHILSGRNKPSLEVVQRILAAMPELAMPWLLNGSGPMLAAVGNAGPEMAPAAIAPAASATASPGASLRHPSDETRAINPVLVNHVATSQQNAASAQGADVPTAPAAGPGRVPVDKVVAPAGRGGKPAPFKPATKPVATPKRFVATPVAAARPVATGEPAAAPPHGAVTPAVAGPPINAAPTEPGANPLSAVPLPATQEAITATSAPEAVAGGAESAMAQALFAGTEKPIRRIVIFYRDGSFADYRPE